MSNDINSQRFKRKRLPDGTASHMSLETHIANIASNPHPQYALLSDLAAAQAGITIDHEIKNDQASVPASSVVYTLSQRLDALAGSTYLTVEAADNRYSNISHTHTPTSIGAAPINHNHDGVYSVENHNHDDKYALIGHSHTGFVLQSDLSAVGVYPEATSAAATEDVIERYAAAPINTLSRDDVQYYVYIPYVEIILEAGTVVTADDYIYTLSNGDYVRVPAGTSTQSGVTYYEEAVNPYQETNVDAGTIITSAMGLYVKSNISNLTFDFNDKTMQQQTYIDLPLSCEIRNAPANFRSGMLNVYRSTIQEYTGSGSIGKGVVVQTLFTDNTLWERKGEIRVADEEYTDTASGETAIRYGVETLTFGNWTTIGEEAIGSLKFTTSSIVPAGYVSANGASYMKAAYPVLWEYAKQCANVDQYISLDNYERYSTLMLDTNLITDGDDPAGYPGCYKYILPTATTLDGLNKTIVDNYVEVAAGTVKDPNAVYYTRSGAADAYTYTPVIVDGDYIPSGTTLYKRETDVGGYVVIKNRLVAVTETTVGLYRGLTFPYISEEMIDGTTTTNRYSGSFTIPDLGGEFLRSWVMGQMDDEDRNIGSLQNAGLPNITGTFNGVKYNSISGAFSQSNTSYQLCGDDEHIRITKISFNASKSSSVYGNSDTVTPQNISVHVLIKAYNGSILPADVGMGTIAEIVLAEFSKFTTATTTNAGIVRLATVNETIAGTSNSLAVTPHGLASVGYVKGITFNETLMDSIAGIVNITGVADEVSNRLDTLETQGIKCTAVSSDEAYVEWAITEDVNPDLCATNMSHVQVNVSLVAINSNGLAYPVGSVINDPVCIIKNQGQSEYMSVPQTAIRKETDGSATTVYVRMYWPLLWYLRAFNSTSSNNYPLYIPQQNEDVSLASIATELANWKVHVNIKY